MSLHAQETSRPARRPLRSTGAVLSGLLLIFAASLATDQLFHAIGVYPPWGEPMSTGQYLLALAYRVVYAVAGSYVAARFAPTRPMLHALVLGAIGVLLSAAGAAAMWHMGDHWYPVSLVLISLPCAWAGGMLYLRSRHHES
ncbi:hypothetical protein [Chelativorans intermedius]|uniref:Uncharacterized protein n=1 Tax=Chelativorans intermedius TaxID=515947 RepID=A0ABV6D9A4_9HYPH|nr:hypothetical protein [Chelativorans intermedius]MCT8999980.1 hypothetical protein [Chelativorans intermedius]